MRAQDDDSNKDSGGSFGSGTSSWRKGQHQTSLWWLGMLERLGDDRVSLERAKSSGGTPRKARITPWQHKIDKVLLNKQWYQLAESSFNWN